MITCEQFYTVLADKGFTYFTGVPDSLFKDWMKFLDDEHGKKLTNRIAPIERDAIALATGYYLATGKIGVVYMQNSGLGNTVNPLTSIVDSSVYGIPMLLMVGWRGEPGIHDEPQHRKMGEISPGLLSLLGIPYSIVSGDAAQIEAAVEKAVQYMQDTNEPYTLLIRKGTFEAYTKQVVTEQPYEMTREEAVTCIAETLGEQDFVVSATGKTSRELYEFRARHEQGHGHDFMMVGAMGCVASVGAEIALQQPDKRVFVFDGDGSLLMGAGGLSTLGHYAPNNVLHIVFDNECHDSTGGQPTVSAAVDFSAMALANSYTGATVVDTRDALHTFLQKATDIEGPYMCVVRIKKGARKDLGRPTTTPKENKQAFMRALGAA